MFFYITSHHIKMVMYMHKYFRMHSVTLLSYIHSHCSTVDPLFHLAPACKWTLLQMLTAGCFPSLSPNASELTDHQPPGLHQEEDDPNLHPNPNPRCLSARPCMPMTLRTRTSSASTLMTLLTSSKKVTRFLDSIQLLISLCL